MNRWTRWLPGLQTLGRYEAAWLPRDLMAGLVGAFVLVFIGVLLSQIDLVNNLQSEIAKRQQEEARRMALEKALAVPPASGRVKRIAHEHHNVP